VDDIAQLRLAGHRSYRNQSSSTENTSFERGMCCVRRIFDIVKAGLAGSHNRLIHTTLNLIA
jgi:hypothetical protein